MFEEIKSNIISRMGSTIQSYKSDSVFDIHIDMYQRLHLVKFTHKLYYKFGSLNPIVRPVLRCII